MPQHLNTKTGTEIKISDKLKERLRKHRATHIKNGNEVSKISKHMAEMRRQIRRQGKSFASAHRVAQKILTAQVRFHRAVGKPRYPRRRSGSNR